MWGEMGHAGKGVVVRKAYNGPLTNACHCMGASFLSSNWKKLKNDMGRGKIEQLSRARFAIYEKQLL